MPSNTWPLLSRLILVLTLIAACGCTRETFPDYASTLGKTATQIKQLTQEFEQQTLLLDKDATLYRDGRLSLAHLQQQLLNTRLTFKRIEFIVEYYYPEHVKAYINGAPLPHLDPYPYAELPLPDGYYTEANAIMLAPLDYQEPNAWVKPRDIVAPEGLQRLDEIVFSADANAGHIKELTSKLVIRTKIMRQALSKRRYIEDYQLFEAARLELIRIFTLGISGFDTPGSSNALPEARTAVESLYSLLSPLLYHLPKDQQAHLGKLFTASIDTLNKNEFNGFDRLDFLKKQINPLYEALLQAHLQLNPTTSASLSAERASWNIHSKNLFAEDFLNPYFYTLLPAESDSPELRELGKKLFHEKKLSHNNTLSCASCHIPEQAFSDGLQIAAADSNALTIRRNTPSIINAVYADRFFYDLRAFSLEEQISHVVSSSAEFNTTLEQIAEKLNAEPDYRADFNKVFATGGKPIHRHQVVAALSSYVVSIRSFDSTFDKYIHNETTAIAPEIAQGFNLFMGKAGCGTCHFPPTFSGLLPPLYKENESEVLGVLQHPDLLQPDTDPGRSNNRVHQEDKDIFRHAFKTTSVRNSEKTAPYFHNGAYSTLEQVVDFYDKGGAQGIGLDYEVPNQTLPPEPLELSDEEKQALIAFIHSLTDQPADY